MKKLIIMAWLLFWWFGTHAQNTSPDLGTSYMWNCLRETVWLEAGVDGKTVQNVSYLDGFGKPFQTIEVNSLPGNNDLVALTEYDSRGRVLRQYVPFPLSQNGGELAGDGRNPGNWWMSGADQGFAFTEYAYEEDFRGRAVSATAPGKAWHVNGKSVEVEYSRNGASEVERWIADASGNLVQDGYYERETLEKTTVTDADGNKSESYTDLNGNVVLEVARNGFERVETRYVYDERGQLRYVLMPEWKDAGDTEAQAYCYEYDERGNLVCKKEPGKGFVSYVYDKFDRLVLQQDGVQREKGAWLYTLYDRRSRVVESGEIVLPGHTPDRLANRMQGLADTLPEGVRTPLQRHFYDGYEPDGGYLPRPFLAMAGYEGSYNVHVNGMETGAMIISVHTARIIRMTEIRFWQRPVTV